MKSKVVEKTEGHQMRGFTATQLPDRGPVAKKGIFSETLAIISESFAQQSSVLMNLLERVFITILGNGDVLVLKLFSPVPHYFRS